MAKIGLAMNAFTNDAFQVCYGTIHILRKHFQGLQGQKMSIFAYFQYVHKKCLCRESGVSKKLKNMLIYYIYEWSLLYPDLCDQVQEFIHFQSFELAEEVCKYKELNHFICQYMLVPSVIYISNHGMCMYAFFQTAHCNMIIGVLKVNTL